MLRITELRLPLNHAEEALRAAIVARLGVPSAALKSFTIFKRGYDARKKSAVVLTYTLDCDVADEAAVLQAHAADPRIRATPDTGYHFVGHAPADLSAAQTPRPRRHRLRAVWHLRRADPRADGPAPAGAGAWQGGA